MAALPNDYKLGTPSMVTCCETSMVQIHRGNNAIRQRDNLYKGTIIMYTGEVMIARFSVNEPEIGEPINCKEWHIYNPKHIGGLL